METAAVYTRRILQRYSVRPRKGLGQNFLISDGIIRGIIAGSGLEAGEGVLEIGPGIGVLTRELAALAGKVWTVELDSNLCGVLQSEFRNRSNVAIVNADALKLQLTEFCPKGSKLRLIANLPYYITSPLINHFLAQRRYLKSMTIMVQKEVAERIVAKPGTKDYGVLSIAVQAFAKTQMLFPVPPDSFIPAPKVYSAVVHLTVLDYPLVPEGEEEHFFRLVKAAFGQRRKTMLNSLSQGLKLNKERISAALNRSGILPDIRAEQLRVEDFLELSRNLLE